MYVPAMFEERDAATLHELMRAFPFATLMTTSADGLNAEHILMEVDAQPAPLGTLRGHVARANPVWRGLADGQPALAVFHGPSAYISPSWYPSKRAHGKVVPTWNYIAVHARGTARSVDDAAWLRGLVGRLTDAHEAGRADAWRVEDAPAEFLDAMLRGIVGIELPIETLQGKWKLSQNRPEADVQGTIDGLITSGGAAACAVAAAMQARLRRA